MRDVHVGRPPQPAHRSAVVGHQIGIADASPCGEWRGCEPHRYAGGGAIQAWQRQSSGERSLYSTIAGGQAREPGCDLAIVGALASAAKSKAIGRTTCAIGEISLTGQVRPVPRLEYRLREAARLGFTTAVVPTLRREIAIPGLSIVQVDTLQDALGAMLQ